MRGVAILIVLFGLVGATFANDRTIGDLQTDETVEIRFESQGCFHSTRVRITIFKAAHFQATVSQLGGTARDLVDLTTDDIANLDGLLSYYRGLEEPGACTTVDTISVLWRGPTIKAFIEPFIDASCGAPEPGRAVIHRLTQLVDDDVVEPSNMPLNPTVGPVAVAAARDQAGRKQEAGATTAPVRPRGLSAIR